ncbi:MAG: hypothetical protein NT075_37185 [Chloroflexi bacterium]|nr:hypothetical protein [Chloroflexota bacterium]
MSYFFIQHQKLVTTLQPPAGMEPLLRRTDWLLPPMITNLHRGFQAWGTLGISPAPVTPERVWLTADGELAFVGHQRPQPLLAVGLAPDLAAWLVLLDKWMETFVVVARARAIWNVQTLAGALTFMSPTFLPRTLVATPPNNWVRVAQALSIALADRPLRGTPTDRHWR